MNDAISRGDLERRIRVYADQVHCRGEVELANGILKALGIVDDAPALDVQPIVHAKWIYGITLRHEWRKCSKCLVSQEIFGCFTYCPNCGALMDGDPHDSGQ